MNINRISFISCRLQQAVSDSFSKLIILCEQSFLQDGDVFNRQRTEEAKKIMDHLFNLGFEEEDEEEEDEEEEDVEEEVVEEEDEEEEDEEEEAVEEEAEEEEDEEEDDVEEEDEQSACQQKKNVFWNPVREREYQDYLKECNAAGLDPDKNPCIHACGECGKLCTRAYLRRHMLTHSTRFKCDFCEKVFTDVSQKNDHERTHTGDKPFSCSYCDKTFTQHSTKVTHERLHTGEKPYPCSYCDKTFTQLSTKNSHERTHTGKKTIKEKDESAAASSSSTRKSTSGSSSTTTEDDDLCSADQC